MQRNKTSLSLVLSIAAFAMLTATQWLHSPLHHLAESVTQDAQHEHLENKAEECCSDSHGEHDHSHHSHAGHSHQKVHEHFGHEHGHEDCPGHPHPDDECEICLFVGKNLGQFESQACLSGIESVEFAPDSVAIILVRTEHDHVLVRGPPVA